MSADKKQGIVKSSFGKTADGTEVDLYTMTNGNGMVAKITTYGGIVVALETPDRNGNFGDVVLGYPDLKGYIENNPFFGCIVGRYGNRIARGKFSLGDRKYTLACNFGENHLHGGIKGFDKVVWSGRPVSGGVALELSYMSRDGEEGYPGNLSAKVVYSLTEKNEMTIDYQATTDKTTIVNLTHHGYFNLDGAGAGDVLDHELVLHADRFTPVDKTLIPTGELRSVQGTPMDFTKPTKVGARIQSKDEQIEFGMGYDHNWVLNGEPGRLSPAAKVTSHKTGRVMEVLTTEPGVQFYSGNFLDGTITGKNGKVYKQRYGLCLETQRFPDSPNQPSFPSTVLEPGETYKTATVFKFSIAK